MEVQTPLYLELCLCWPHKIYEQYKQGRLIWPYDIFYELLLLGKSSLLQRKRELCQFCFWNEKKSHLQGLSSPGLSFLHEKLGRDGFAVHMFTPAHIVRCFYWPYLRSSLVLCDFSEFIYQGRKPHRSLIPTFGGVNLCIDYSQYVSSYGTQEYVSYAPFLVFFSKLYRHFFSFQKRYTLQSNKVASFVIFYWGGEYTQLCLGIALGSML